jgi:hypothetical protein
VNQGDVVTFTARAAGGTSNLRGASLEFGDGAAQALDLTAAPIKIPHEYTRAGTFTARLAATDGGGTVLSSSQVVRVGPVVSASVNAVGTGGLSILATADVQGAPVALYEWFFDGPLATTSTTLNQVRFTYESRGHKDFWVRITLGDGRTVRASSAIVLE